MELMKTNVKSRQIGADILLYGACIRDEHPKILKSFRQKTKLSICLQDGHIDSTSWKITAIVRANNPKTISVLTVDGSPHCVQLHYAVEDVKKLFPTLKVSHYVIEKGKLFEVSSDAVKKSRRLRGIEDLL